MLTAVQTETSLKRRRRRSKGQIPTLGHVPRRLFPLNEAAAYLGRSIWSIRELLWAEKIPYVREGKRIFVDVRDMDAWIEKNKHFPTP